MDIGAANLSFEYTIRSNIKEDGFATTPAVLNSVAIATLIDSLGPMPGAGRRGLLGIAVMRELATSTKLLDLVRPHLPAEPRPVRAIYFDKTPESNWPVAWHQDLTLALSHRLDLPGFGPWSTKDGITHVQPPIEFLEKMLSVRLHLDDCDEANGALKVLPGSHRFGRLDSNQIAELRTKQPGRICVAAAGDAFLMRPLLLHASGRSTSSGHRRVLHIDFAGFKLPEGLEWHPAA